MFETGQNRQKRQIDKETNRRKSVYGDSKKLNCDRENTSLGGADKNIWEVFSRGGINRLSFFYMGVATLKFKNKIKSSHSKSGCINISRWRTYEVC